MDSLVSEKKALSLVRESSFMSWKVVLWVTLDIKPLNRLGLMPTWLVLLQIKLRITIISNGRLNQIGRASCRERV